MFATIRIAARLFKAGKAHLKKLGKVCRTHLKKPQKQVKNLSKKIISRVKELLNCLRPKKPDAHKPLIKLPKAKPKYQYRYQFRKQAESKSRNQVPKQIVRPRPEFKEVSMQHQESLSSRIEAFYKEWTKAHGPALNSLDKKFLESAKPETVELVIENARKTLKSPYLKAVYNGLKDLQDISDLLMKDEEAKKKVYKTLKHYSDQGPEKFYWGIQTFHDKGNFPTRSGERRLNLDPRLISEWLGLAAG